MSLTGLPLTLASTGDIVEVTAIGGERVLKKRLGDLGVIAGQVLDVVRKDVDGQMVVALGDARFALGREMARQIFVAPVSSRHEGRK
ncbi:MAG: ferrous iron transport protein A [Tropicimonas sp.]|uniref:FeoA family protein n=1 Tax=Tropicimonas sp. TaxID=2067044 RepID=UPI003A8BC71B